MSYATLPGGRLALTLAFTGGAALVAVGLSVVLYRESVPMPGVALATGWGVAALALGIALRTTRPALLSGIGILWLVLALVAWAWLWWSQNV